MTVEETYEQFIVKINKNAQTDGVHCDRGRFTVLYNESQIRHLEYILDRRNEDEIRYAEKFLVPDESLPIEEETETYSTSELPKDYFDFGALIADAKTDYCTKATITLNETKIENIDLVLQDEFNKPSFDYRESVFRIANGAIIAYQNDFTYNNMLLTYYRYPQKIELINNDDPESPFNTAKEIEWDDKSNNRIVDLCASRFFMNNDDQKYQAAKMESIQKK